MKRGKLIFLGIILAGVFIIVYLINDSNNSAVVQGKIIDEISKDAVWDAWISVGEKSTLKFRGTTYKLTGIKPGRYEIKVNAPYYEDFKKEVVVKKGVNTVDIIMRGTEIAGLDSILAFVETTDKGVGVEIRLLDKDKSAILHPPALKMNLEGVLYLNEDGAKGKTPLTTLYKGPIEMSWDPEELLAHNKGFIPWDKIQFKPGESEQYGTMKITLDTPQGNFDYVIKDVELFAQAGVK